ncbi:MAG: hypothetical protein R3F54_09275 [Alphaproteobacteria bacterium]
MLFDGGTRPRIGLRTIVGSGRVLLLGGLLHLASGASASAETLILEDGTRIEGAVVSVTATTLAIRLANGSLRQLRRQDLAEVRLTLGDRTDVQGALARWANGVYSLRIGEALVNIRDGEVIGMEALDAEAQGVGGPADAIEPAAGRQTYIPPPIFVLKGGATVVGRVQAASRASVMLRLATGGERVLQLAEIDRVVIRDRTRGGPLEGGFLGWEDGVYSLEVDGRSVRIQDGRPIEGKPIKRGGPVM